MHQLGEIGSFQFENLARSRVPFSLVLIGIEVPMKELDHELLRPVWERSIALPVLDSVDRIVEKISDKELPVVIVAVKPVEAKDVALVLNELGYYNCYFLGISAEDLFRDLTIQFF